MCFMDNLPCNKFKDLDEFNEKMKKVILLNSGCRIRRQFGGVIKNVIKII